MFDSFMKRRVKAAGDAKLMLTPMVDMFTILLVFLIMSFSPDDPVDVQGLNLAHSSQENTLKDAIRVSLATDALRVQDVFIADIREGQVAGVAVDGQRIVPLFDVLRRLKGERLSELERRGEDATQEDAVLVVLVDRGTPYELLHQVLFTAAQAGYPNARFGVLKGAPVATLGGVAGGAP